MALLSRTWRKSRAKTWGVIWGIRDHGTCRPWARVPRASWHIDARRTLTIGNGWRRIVATVPADKRAAVEALLEKKLGPRDADSP